MTNKYNSFVAMMAVVAAATIMLTFIVASDVFAQSADAILAAKFREATAAQRAGRLDEAATAYQEVLKMRPDLAEVYVNFGLVRHEQKRFEEAVAAFEKALALKPSLAAARLFLGIDYYSLNKLEAALKTLEEAARLAPNDPQALLWLGLAQMAAGKASEAAKQLDAAAAIAPNDVEILYHRGRAHLKVSQESYRRMFKADPQSARVRMVLGQSYAEAGRDAEAVAEYELAAKLAPNMPGVHEAVGSLYWKNKQLNEAEAAFGRELKNDPYNTLAMYKLGSIRVERGKPAEGIRLLESAVQQSPENLDSHYYLGKAQGVLGQNEQAVANFNKLIAGDPSSKLVESAYYQLSRIYRKMGRATEARQALESFQKLKNERDAQEAEKIKERQTEPMSGSSSNDKPQ